MTANPLPEEFSLLTGGAELLHRVAPLWSQLRRHHADLAPQWSGSLLAGSFEQRQAELIRKGGRGFLVSLAILRGHDVGYCVSTITSDATGELDSLYVLPSHRGHGVGHALMLSAMNWFDGQSIQKIIVDVISGNDAAQRFYARYGFLPRTVRLLRPGASLA